MGTYNPAIDVYIEKGVVFINKTILSHRGLHHIIVNLIASWVILFFSIAGLISRSPKQDKKFTGNNKTADTAIPPLKNSLASPSQQPVNLSDTFKKFKVDDYPVTAAMLKHNDHSSDYRIRYKDVVSHDKVWLTNDALRQTLVFEMYTDGFRLAIFHFSNDKIPAELIKKMEFNTPDGEIASDKQKLDHFKNFIPFARKINAVYFKSIKGFKLGDPKKKILSIYGKPDSIKIKKGIEEYVWNFIGELLYDGKQNLNGKPLAKDNYGHQVTMYFRDNKLTGIILLNDIP